MTRRFTIMALTIVATMFVATDSVWACKFLDNLFNRQARRTCCKQCIMVPPCCSMPKACAPVGKIDESGEAVKDQTQPTLPADGSYDKPVDKPVDPSPSDQSTEKPVEAPILPPDQPVEKPVEQPAEQPAEKPVEQPAVTPVVPPVEQPKPADPVAPVTEPAVPATEPAVPATEPATPATEPAAPADPADPLAPVVDPMPADPVVTPADPVAPVEPATEPADPLAPVEPAIEPTDPLAPVEPMPADPVVDPAATPADPAATPADPAAAPAVPKADDDPFSLNDARQFRQWTDVSGKYHVEARVVSCANGVVRLEKADGKFVRIDLIKLCDADQSAVLKQIEKIATIW